jgi:hypothetical protein
VSAVPHAYQYLYPSVLTADAGAPTLRLATSDADGQSHPYFFEGRVREPRLVAELLTAVHLVVGSRWVRGMLEVQSYQAAMHRVWASSGLDALRFFRTLPKASTSRTPLWIARGPGGMYATTREVQGGVRITDTTRLRVLPETTRTALSSMKLGGQGDRIRRELLA